MFISAAHVHVAWRLLLCLVCAYLSLFAFTICLSFAVYNLFVCTGAEPSAALLDCKLSSGLRLPEDLAAVAHGDATLNLDNFMCQVHV